MLTSFKPLYSVNSPYLPSPDKRTEGWFLVDSLYNVLALIGIYLAFFWFLQNQMTKRKPLQLQGLLIVYNLGMIFLNAFIFKELLTCSLRLDYNYLCQPCKEEYHLDELRIASAIWWFYISKLLEVCDTIFFILCKKSNQITFLHVYHHSTMFALWWIAIKWIPTGSTFFPALVNSFIHIIMYTYYTLSVVAKRNLRYLWWKKYLTVLQMLQFTLGLLWSVQAIINSCDFPMWTFWVNSIYMISFLFLFGKFYADKY